MSEATKELLGLHATPGELDMARARESVVARGHRARAHRRAVGAATVVIVVAVAGLGAAAMSRPPTKDRLQVSAGQTSASEAAVTPPSVIQQRIFDCVDQARADGVVSHSSIVDGSSPVFKDAPNLRECAQQVQAGLSDRTKAAQQESVDAAGAALLECLRGKGLHPTQDTTSIPPDLEDSFGGLPPQFGYKFPTGEYDPAFDDIKAGCTAAATEAWNRVWASYGVAIDEGDTTTTSPPTTVR